MAALPHAHQAAATLPFPLLGPVGARRCRCPRGSATVGPRLRHRLGPPLPRAAGAGALVETVGRALVTALARPQVSGLDRLDALVDGDHGPVIFAANHHSHVDTPVLLTAIPDTWRHKLFVGGAADYFFRTRLTSALSALAIGAIPIERTRVSRRSADRSAELIDAGWSMLIFPEGGRSPDGWGQPFHGGAAYLALRCGVPVVPIHLHGTGRILRKGKRWPTPATATVTFGAPLVPEPGDNARRLSATIQRAVEALADEATTDWWSARRRAHAAARPR